MPKAKPVSLHPLNFEDALQALIRVDPARVGLEHKQRKPRGKRVKKASTKQQGDKQARTKEAQH